jgi:Zn-dependent peptidase ImmA (M78 family)
MSKQSNLMRRSQSFFREAARQAVLPLAENELDEFLQRVSLVADINPNFASKLKEIFPQQHFRLSTDLATEMASRIRYFLGVDDVVPLFNLPTLLDEKLNVLLFPIEQNRLAGACAAIDKFAFIFVSGVAQEDILFTCAHELAHLIILSARQKNKGGAILDPADNMSIPLKVPYELFADMFAQELLIPNRGLGIALQKVRSLLSETNAVTDTQLLYLARIFGVSLYTMARKCEKEKLLPKGASAKLNRRLIEKHGGPENRADVFRVPPRPEIRIASVPYSLELAVIKEINRSEALIGSTATRTRQKEGVSPIRP